MSNIAIEMKNICKTFGATKANENVNFSASTGEVHALLGENGAGKSTLMNMLSGIYNPDSGEIFIYGKSAVFSSPKDPIKLGIGMIHQHFKLVEVLSAKDNIILGQDGPQIIKGKKLSNEIKDLIKKYGLDIDPDKKVYAMSVGEKQTLEIIKVLYRGANILIMDEPTAVLTPQEIKKLFQIIRNMKAQGCTIVIITHKLNEVMEISDRVTVLRKGQTIGTVETKQVQAETLIEMMVGKAVTLEIDRKDANLKEDLLKIKDINVLSKDHHHLLKNVSFSLAGGEILGVAGVAGSGQKELCEVLTGLLAQSEGQVFLEGDDISGKSPREIIKLGIRLGFVPEDRLGMGLIGSMDIVSNLILKDYQNDPGILIKRKHLEVKAEEMVEKLDIQTPGINYPVKKLSGGNIQKVLLGREIDSKPKVLITAYPVRGLDIGASYKIYDLLNEEKSKGCGVIFVGEDLDVILALCDRIMVLCHGEITGIIDAKKTTKEEIGLLMTGGYKDNQEVALD